MTDSPAPATPPRNDELVAALRRLEEENTAEAGRAVHDALRTGTLLLPVQTPPGGPVAGEEADAASRVEVVVLRDAEGRQALPVFTDEEALRSWMPEGATFVVVEGPTLVRMLGDAPPDALLINVAGPVGGELNREQIGLLVGDGDRQQVPPQTNVRFTAVQDPPVGLVPLLREALAAQEEVSEGYLLMLSVGEQEPALTLGAVFDGEPSEEKIRATFEQIAEHVKLSLGEEQRLGLIPVGGEMLEVLRANLEPVYEGF